MKAKSTKRRVYGAFIKSLGQTAFGEMLLVGSERYTGLGSLAIHIDRALKIGPS